MRTSLTILFGVFALIAYPVFASDVSSRRSLVVVFEGPSTVSAHTFYRSLRRNKRTGVGALPNPDWLVPRSMERQLPISSTTLLVGPPEVQVIEGLPIPFFVMGLDSTSLRWFDQASKQLAEMGARGVIVEAQSLVQWQEFLEHANKLGIQAQLLNGDSLAVGYGIRTYPIVLMNQYTAEARPHE